ncbi:TetR/AcrR family transcriptional regulator [Cohnella sp. LGH]|uniref:TetR family transcriptional regulator n=1 Tax=Cohnella phaseoli TaxID=456490 RepID=A0A3D9JM71_9BACL|nr:MULTISPECIES: TetR/AcrR family transcriptional regulator [Cohnella]QTH45222.1 TetR/AcrR family transcriptional regulator [Cohnella sp. LGH]RED75044.1 TetR family transcriptional regulator [Cohnella phaseoli]
MNGFQKRREQKKQQILRSLHNMIMNRNFQEIGVREIAKEAGVSPASIYNFFGSKEELAKQIFYHLMEEEGEAFQKMMEADIPFEEKMENMYALSISNQETLNNDGLKNFMFEDPVFTEHIEQYSRTVVIPAIMKLIEQGKQEQKISGGVSSEAILFFMNVIMQMLGSSSVRDKLNVEMRKEIGHLFFYGIFGKKP